ncbi:hypothetical protein BDF19DRAFT_419034 [Syncephalis fuscata]|nr:hypothetical protein BDF19DRAFT_419034 [Syncephalis fuscata]
MNMSWNENDRIHHWQPKDNNTNWHPKGNGKQRNLNYHWLGRVSTLDYLSSSDNLDEAQERNLDNAVHTLIDVLILYIFIRNTWCSIRLIRLNSRSIAHWSCFLQAFCGVFFTVMTLSSLLGSAITCKICIWTENFGLAISSICVTVCLLIKAYAVQMRDRRVIYVGVFFIMLQLVYPWLFWSQVMFFVATSARCGINFGPYYAWYRFGVEMVINFVFSALFLRTVIRQYQTFGSGCWKKLKSDGLLFLFAVMLSNVICIVVSTVLGSTSLPKSFLTIDCKGNNVAAIGTPEPDDANCIFKQSSNYSKVLGVRGL